jgi:hypothetical protein
LNKLLDLLEGHRLGVCRKDHEKRRRIKQ